MLMYNVIYNNDIVDRGIMSPRQLEYFLEIYKQKSIKRAAEKLIVSAQAISKTIKEIESELGVTLFIRGKRQLEPTLEAEELKNHAIKILEEFEKINQIKHFSYREDLTLTVYAIDGFLEYITIDFIEDFQRAYPDITLNIVEASEKEIIRKLENREIDSAILTKTPNNCSFKFVYLYSNRNCLVIHKDHPLAQNEFISALDLNHLPIAGKGNNYSCYNNNLSKMFQNHIHPNVRLETTNDSLIINMAERNLAIGITLDYLAFGSKSENTVIRPFKDKTQLRNVFWVENNYTLLNKQEQLFRDFLIQWIEKNQSKLFQWEISN